VHVAVHAPPASEGNTPLAFTNAGGLVAAINEVSGALEARRTYP